MTDRTAQLTLDNKELDCITDLFNDILDRISDEQTDEFLGWDCEYVEGIYEKFVAALRESMSIDMDYRP